MTRPTTYGDLMMGIMVVDAAKAGLRPFVGQIFASATSLKMHNFEEPHDGTTQGMVEALAVAITKAKEASDTAAPVSNPRPADAGPIVGQ